jgi:hypothetical protein
VSPYFERDSLFDPQATSGQQRIENTIPSRSVGHDFFNLLGRPRRSVLLLGIDGRHADEVRVPCSGMNLFAFLVNGACYHRLKDLKVTDGCFVREPNLFHAGNQFLRSSVLDVRQRRIANVRSEPFNGALMTGNGRWLYSSTLPAMEHSTVFNRLNPPISLLAESATGSETISRLSVSNSRPVADLPR